MTKKTSMLLTYEVTENFHLEGPIITNYIYRSLKKRLRPNRNMMVFTKLYHCTWNLQTRNFLLIIEEYWFGNQLSMKSSKYWRRNYFVHINAFLRIAHRQLDVLPSSACTKPLSGNAFALIRRMTSLPPSHNE